MALRRVTGAWMRWAVWGILLGLMLVVAPQPAHASLLGGIADILQGAVALPMGILGGTLSGPPIIGTLGGVLSGAMQTVGFTTRGIFELAGAAIPLATSVAPYIPLFL